MSTTPRTDAAIKAYANAISMRLQQCAKRPTPVDADSMEALETENMALRRDADRYRFLRDMAFLDSPDSRADFANLEALTGEAFDNAIDNLMNP